MTDATHRPTPPGAPPSPSPGSRLRRGLQGTLVALLALTVGLVFMGLTGLLHLESPAFRRSMADGVSGAVSIMVPGGVWIDGLGHPLSTPLRVQRVGISSPGGAHVIELHDVAVWPDWGAMVARPGLVVTQADVGSGHVNVDIGASGRTTLEDALVTKSAKRARGRGAEGDGSSAPPLLEVDEIRFGELEITVSPPKGPRVRFAQVHGVAHVILPRGDEVRIRAFDVGAVLQSDAVDVMPEIPLRQARVWVDGSRVEVASVRGRVGLLGGELPVAYVHNSAEASGCMCLLADEATTGLVGVVARLGSGLTRLVPGDGIMEVGARSAPDGGPPCCDRLPGETREEDAS